MVASPIDEYSAMDSKLMKLLKECLRVSSAIELKNNSGNSIFNTVEFVCDIKVTLRRTELA